MKKVGFLTSELDPLLIADDRSAFAPLLERGIVASPVIWDRPHDLSAFDGLVFRSCWNYHRKHGEFLNFLESLRNLEIPVLNPLPVIEWNLNKKHILGYESKLLIPKTRFFAAKKLVTTRDFGQIAQEWQVDCLVIKPAVSLNGEDTYLLKVEDLETIEQQVSALLAERDVLVQEFIPEIKTSGELSLIFFNKKFSHAVRKVPAKNEFRVHSEYGGTRTSAEASKAALSYGAAVLNEIAEDLLYARVDIVESAKGPVLIELEVTDPCLYLSTCVSAAGNFADAIARTLS